uniref:Uncharacterized protein n=1 Tax=Laticauda laticaudata TaxID=8630 RepID=A0A8C5SSS7_LATLA
PGALWESWCAFLFKFDFVVGKPLAVNYFSRARFLFIMLSCARFVLVLCFSTDLSVCVVD